MTPSEAQVLENIKLASFQAELAKHASIPIIGRLRGHKPPPLLTMKGVSSENLSRGLKGAGVLAGAGYLFTKTRSSRSAIESAPVVQKMSG